MEESGKVKKTSISVAFLFLAIIFLGIMSYKSSDDFYAMDASALLGNLTTSEYIISPENLEPSGNILVDIRNPYEFEKGHFENAINIPTPDILKEDNLELFQNWKDSQKVVVLYGKDIEEANIPFLLLYQIGYDNLKLLNADNRYVQNKLITQPTNIEKPIINIQAFIDESVEKSKRVVVKKEIKPVPKKVIPVKKKKKRPVEGGC